MRLHEFTNQSKTPDQQRMDGLKAAKDRANQALQAEKQRQKVTKAQQALNVAKLTKPAMPIVL
jgi:hypothetical protein